MRFEAGTLFISPIGNFLAWVEILNSGTFCANAQNVSAPKNALIAIPIFGAEGRRLSNMGFKMTAIVELVGIEYVFEVISMTVLEICLKTYLTIAAFDRDWAVFGKFHSLVT